MLSCYLLLLVGLSWSFTLEGGPFRRERIAPVVGRCGTFSDTYFFQVGEQAADSLGNLYVVYRTNNPGGNSSKVQPPGGTLPGPDLVRPPSFTAPDKGYIILAKLDASFSLLWQVWIESQGGNKNCGSDRSLKHGVLRLDPQGNAWLSVSTYSITFPGLQRSTADWRVANSTGQMLNVTGANSMLLKFQPTGQLAWYDYSLVSLSDYAVPIVSFAPADGGSLLATWLFPPGGSWATVRMADAGHECLCPGPTSSTSNRPDCTCFIHYDSAGVVTSATVLSTDAGAFVVAKDVQWLGPNLGQWAVSLYYGPNTGLSWELTNNMTLGGQPLLTAIPPDIRMGATVLYVDQAATVQCSRTFWSSSCCNSMMFARGSYVMDGFWYGLYYYGVGYIIDDDFAATFSPPTITTYNYAGDIFLVKLDRLCNVVWHRTNQGGTLEDFGFAMTGDKTSGYLYVSLASDSVLPSSPLQFLGAGTNFGVQDSARTTPVWGLMGNAMTGIAAFRSTDGLLAGADYMQQPLSPAPLWDSIAKVSSMAVLSDGRLCVGGQSNASLVFRNSSLNWSLAGLAQPGVPGFFFCYPAAPPQPPGPTDDPTTRVPTSASPSSSFSPSLSSSRPTGPPGSSLLSAALPSLLVVVDSQTLPYLDLSATSIVVTAGALLQVDTLVATGPVTITVDIALSSLEDGLQIELLSYTTLQGDLGNLHIVLANGGTSDCWQPEASVQEQKVYVIFSIQSGSCTGQAHATRSVFWANQQRIKAEL